MISFLIALAVLVGGYFIYGLVVEKIFGIDSKRPMPCDTMRDGVDYVPMSTWKVFLIQFLNIAGLGPIFEQVFYSFQRLKKIGFVRPWNENDMQSSIQ